MSLKRFKNFCKIVVCFFLIFYLKKMSEIKRKRKTLITCLVLCMVINNIQGQPNLSFHHLSSANGLTSKIVNHIFQDSRGFLWISTEDGLNMYDGETIKQFYVSDFVSSQTYNNYTGAITEDVDHNILVAGQAGIAKFTWATKLFSIVYKNDFSAFGNLFPDLFVDENKNIWINERIRIKQFDPHFHLLHTWNLHNNTANYLNGPSNTFIIGEDVLHNIWIKDFDSIFLINVKTDKISVANSQLHTINIQFKYFNCVTVTGNSIWVIANDFTLLHMNANFKLLASYELPHIIFPSYNNVVEQNGNIWLGTFDGGVLRIDGHTGKMQQYKSNDGLNDLSSNYTSCVVKDANENIFVGTNAGISEWRAGASFFHQLNFKIPGSPQYTIQRIFSENNFLFSFTSAGAIQSQLINNASQYFIGKKIYYTTAFPFDDKWIVSNSSRIEFWKITNNRLTHFPFVSPHPSILDSTGVVSFYKDHDKNIWMGLFNDAGVICWHTWNNSFNYYSQKNTGKTYFPLRHFKYAMEDNKGNIWMGYEKGGIAIFNKKQQRFVSPPAFDKDSINNVAVTGMINDLQNHLWIATNTGLIRYDESENFYQRLTRKDGLPSNDVSGIEQDESGNIWAGFEGSLASINISVNKITTYTSADGLPDEQLQNPTYDKLSKIIFFCTDHDVIYFDPQQVKKIIPSLNPVITSFQVMGKEQPFANNKLELPYSQNYLAFNFSAPNFINAAENEYECKLDGADKNWLFLGSHHFANYSRLQPGDYNFRVRVRVRNGKWNESSPPLTISILTPFWRTTWFWILCTVLFLSIAFLFFYVRLRNKFEKQILVQSIRDKIAGDLHDDIGSTLSSISIWSELAKQTTGDVVPLLENITKNTWMMQENMSDIVWTINPKNDRFGNITRRMSQFAAELLESKNMIVNFVCDQSLTTLMLPMEKRKNFYLLFKEAINNCAKYSAATRVNILISKTDNEINLTIEDDGKGFDSKKEFAGNGMTTMKTRAALLNGVLQITSGKDKGTIVELNFKV
jgi:ligand-binding sensor domain-containing protein